MALSIRLLSISRIRNGSALIASGRRGIVEAEVDIAGQRARHPFPRDVARQRRQIDRLGRMHAAVRAGFRARQRQQLVDEARCVVGRGVQLLQGGCASPSRDLPQRQARSASSAPAIGVRNWCAASAMKRCCAASAVLRRDSRSFMARTSGRTSTGAPASAIGLRSTCERFSISRAHGGQRAQADARRRTIPPAWQAVPVLPAAASCAA